MAVTTGTAWDLVLTDPPPPAPRTGTVSPRAAYQALLYGRAVAVDLRPTSQREREGALHGTWGVVLGAAELGPWLRESLATRVLLLGDAAEAGDGGDDRVRLIDGGVPAWRAAGLPVG